ncbi:uncharacterized protein EDB93DRAFT_1123025 [Suillus bovinus]|uniref:uncharacterized protein n=1 Tax=Suillus bovinus TaxID=48563 RepID=UPI001B86BF39|nr:uncharacterized protein EDB93DRAFT_1123025 [Suillus bovinus]KAG2158121.1 hypothetical protein EDB93DRAFT_1123025 [Suillus bovinus]
MVALSLDNVSSQKHQSHLHDHAIDALLQNSEALALDDDNAIDALLQNSEALTLDDDYTIDAILQNSEALTLDKTPAINALSLDGNHAIDALLHNSEALTLDNNHAIQVDALLHKSDAHTHDNASQSSEPMLHDNSDDRSSHWHLRRNSTNTLLRNIEIIDPRNFNHDTPYTTMLSTPYFEIWNLLFLMITPHSR